MTTPGGRRARPAGPTAAELSTVVELARSHHATLVNVGHGRDPRSTAGARAFIETWAELGGEIGTVVSWPAVAASWLRPACRLAAGTPDAWIIADEASGWAGIGRRLAATEAWRARRTVGFAMLADPRLPAVAGVDATEGLCGAGPDGTVWAFRNEVLLTGHDVGVTRNS